MPTKHIKTLLNTFSYSLLLWIAYVIYGSFTNQGIWKMVVSWLASASNGRYSPSGAFAISVLIGLLPLIGLTAALWWVLSRKSRK